MMTLPDPARYAMDAAAAIGAQYTDLDNGGGYLFRISKNGREIVAGAGGWHDPGAAAGRCLTADALAVERIGDPPRRPVFVA